MNTLLLCGTEHTVKDDSDNKRKPSAATSNATLSEQQQNVL